MFRKCFVGPFGTEFDFPTLEQVAAVLLASGTFYLTAPDIDGYVPVHIDEKGRVTDWDKVEQENLGFKFSPSSKVRDVYFDDCDDSYVFTLCEETM